MKQTFRLALLTSLFFLTFVATGYTAVEWELGPAITTKTAPLATAISLDGKWTFVLAEGGKILIYNADGALDDTIPVDPAMDGIAINGTGDKLFLSSSRNKTVQQINISFIAAINTEGAPSLGPETTPVEIVVFSDFQCPYCSKVGPLLEYVLEHNPGTVRIVYKNFPLPFHKFSRAAAIAALAAQNQGKFWEFHDILFQHSQDLDIDKINTLAKEAGLDLTRFKADMANPALAGRVTRDMEDGQRAGVRGTPTIFVNGRTLKERNPEGLQALVEQELARSKGE